VPQPARSLLHHSIAAASVLAAAFALFTVIGRTTAPQVAANTWAATGDMIQARAGASAALMADGGVLVAGGTDDAGASASAS